MCDMAGTTTHPGPRPGRARHLGPKSPKSPRPAGPAGFCRSGGYSEGQSTRSHPELGRENPQRRWYCRFSAWKSRSPPGPQNPEHPTSAQSHRPQGNRPKGTLPRGKPKTPTAAGWSSPVARQAHNLKVAGSNPAPATITPPRRPSLHSKYPQSSPPETALPRGFFQRIRCGFLALVGVRLIAPSQGADLPDRYTDPT